MKVYHFNINTYKIEVTAENQKQYQVNLDGVYAGMIYPKFIKEDSFTIWKSNDLIPEDLLQKIGAAIQGETDPVG